MEMQTDINYCLLLYSPGITTLNLVEITTVFSRITLDIPQYASCGNLKKPLSLSCMNKKEKTSDQKL